MFRLLFLLTANRVILNSLKKTNRVLFLDEDVPGGTTAYMMQEVLEKHGGWNFLDTPAKDAYCKGTPAGVHH